MDTPTTPIRARRKRGAAKDAPVINASVSPASKDKLDRVADALGLSLGQVLDLVFENTHVDADGRPSWWSGQLAAERLAEAEEAAPRLEYAS